MEVRNRFKGLDLINRVPDELWMEVHDIVQEKGSKTIPKKKKCKKPKWLSGEALQIAVKRTEMKSKGEKERYTHLNAEFQRIARRDNPVYETAKETLMYKTVFWTLREGEGWMIWENGIEICIISYMKFRKMVTITLYMRQQKRH